MLKDSLKILLRSFVISIKEWKFLLGMIILGGLNIALTIENILELALPKKIAYSLVQFVLLGGYIGLLGALARKVYHLEPLSWSERIRRSSISALIFFVFVVMWFALSKGISFVTSNFWIGFILYLIYMLLVTSVILELIKAYFLEKDIFSLYDVFSRLGNIKYLMGYLLVILVSIILYPISEYLSSALAFLGTSHLWVFKMIYYTFHGVILGYITLVVLYFYIQVLNLE